MTRDHVEHDHEGHDHGDDHEHSHEDWDDPEARYAHLRADVQKRRTGYKTIIALGVLTLVVSIVDILLLDQVLFLPVIGLYVVLAVVAVILYFSRRVKEETDEAEDQEDESEVAIELREREGTSYDFGDVRRGALSCPSCRNVFQLGLEHFGQHKSVFFTCPECGEAARLPTGAKKPIEADLPAKPVHDSWYHCDHCGEDWSVGTFGHEGRTSHFEACPHCGTKDEIMVRRVVDA